MAPSDGWYLVGPLLVLGLVAVLAGWMCTGLERGADLPPEPHPGAPAIFDGRPDDGDDFGLLRPVALTRDPDLADEILGLLAHAGIRSTHAVRPDASLVVLVFAEEAETARRLMGGSPAL